MCVFAFFSFCFLRLKPLWGQADLDGLHCHWDPTEVQTQAATEYHVVHGPTVAGVCVATKGHTEAQT